jgi:K+-transporting ATPase KdpF subunit
MLTALFSPPPADAGQQEIAKSQAETAWSPFGSAADGPDGLSVGPMTVAEGLLLAISVAVFIYLGVAMFRPERF